MRKVGGTKPVSLIGLLGISVTEGKLITADLWETYATCDSLADLAERIVEKYGAEAVYSSMCVFILLEKESREISGGVTCD